MTMRVHAYFQGRVQGVGFRWTAKRTADEMGVCGRVRNLPDGSVEMVAEAFNRPTLETFVDRLAKHFHCKASAHYGGGAEDLTDFRIVHGLGPI